MSSDSDFIRPKIINKNEGLYGYVDFINKEGIGGWVLDIQSSEPRVVEIYIGEEKAGEALANMQRPDISQILGKEIRCGFYARWSEIRLPSDMDNLDIAIIDKLSGREIIGKHVKRGEPKLLKRVIIRKPEQGVIAGDNKVMEEYRIIKESGFFDEEWYLNTYPDVKKNGWDPIMHYILYGWKERKNPSEEFDTDYYLNSNIDVYLSGMNPLVHFILTGILEGSVPKQKTSHLDYKISYIINLIAAQKKPSIECVPET